MEVVAVVFFQLYQPLCPSQTNFNLNPLVKYMTKSVINSPTCHNKWRKYYDKIKEGYQLRTPHRSNPVLNQAEKVPQALVNLVPNYPPNLTLTTIVLTKVIINPAWIIYITYFLFFVCIASQCSLVYASSWHLYWWTEI